MILIVGGAYQGKRAYALEALGLDEGRVVDHVELRIRKWVDEGLDPVMETERCLPAWRDKALLLEDVCCGIVPMDARDRAYREAVGRCGTLLSKNAQRVVRVFCGIGTVIKDA